MRKPQIHVEPRPDGRWAVRTDGTRRAASLHDTEADAVARGGELAKRYQSELVIVSKRHPTREQLEPADSGHPPVADLEAMKLKIARRARSRHDRE
jgi:hypothetical protein